MARRSGLRVGGVRRACRRPRAGGRPGPQGPHQLPGLRGRRCARAGQRSPEGLGRRVVRPAPRQRCRQRVASGRRPRRLGELPAVQHPDLRRHAPVERRSSHRPRGRRARRAAAAPRRHRVRRRGLPGGDERGHRDLLPGRPRADVAAGASARRPLHDRTDGRRRRRRRVCTSSGPGSAAGGVGDGHRGVAGRGLAGVPHDDVRWPGAGAGRSRGPGSCVARAARLRRTSERARTCKRPVRGAGAGVGPAARAGRPRPRVRVDAAVVQALPLRRGDPPVHRRLPGDRPATRTCRRAAGEADRAPADAAADGDAAPGECIGVQRERLSLGCRRVGARSREARRIRRTRAPGSRDRRAARSDRGARRRLAGPRRSPCPRDDRRWAHLACARATRTRQSGPAPERCGTRRQGANAL